MSAETAMVETCYGPVSADVMARAAKIRLLICDVDGVMSDGVIYMGNSGEELKAFNVRDGYGVRCLLTSGVEVAIITGRKAKLLEDRCKTLGITHLYQGQSDKLLAWRELLDKLSLTADQVAYIAVADAHPILLPRAHYVTRIAGGRGAVRELCDLILMAQNKFEDAKGQSI